MKCGGYGNVTGSAKYRTGLQMARVLLVIFIVFLSVWFWRSYHSVVEDRISNYAERFSILNPFRLLLESIPVIFFLLFAVELILFVVFVSTGVTMDLNNGG
jgi:uncharacterized membrane protein YtjA (UPF0391 family)